MQTKRPLDLQQNDTAKFVRCRVAADVLGLSEATVRKAVHRGDIPGVRIGSNTLVSRAALAEMITGATPTSPTNAEE